MSFALNLINSNPQVANSPYAQNAIKAIRNNDAQLGIQLANNFLNSVGMTREQGMASAMSHFRMR